MCCPIRVVSPSAWVSQISPLFNITNTNNFCVSALTNFLHRPWIWLQLCWCVCLLFMIKFQLTVLKLININKWITVLVSLHAVPQVLSSFFSLSGKMSFNCMCLQDLSFLIKLSIGWCSDLLLVIVASLPHLWTNSLYMWQWSLCALPLPLWPLRRLWGQQWRGGVSVQTMWPQRRVRMQQWPLHCQRICLQRHK